MRRPSIRRTAFALAVAGVLASAASARAAEDAVVIPPPAADIAPADALRAHHEALVADVAMVRRRIKAVCAA